MTKSASRFGPAFTPVLDAVDIGRKANLQGVPVMIYGEDVTHVVTEQGIAYLYMAQNAEERTKLLGSVAQGTPIGSLVTPDEIRRFRAWGKVALPEDLGISPDKANRTMLAAQSLEEIAEISGGLYHVPERFQKKK